MISYTLAELTCMDHYRECLAPAGGRGEGLESSANKIEKAYEGQGKASLFDLVSKAWI